MSPLPSHAIEPNELSKLAELGIVDTTTDQNFPTNTLTVEIKPDPAPSALRFPTFVHDGKPLLGKFTVVNATNRVGRNEKCPCGSGKKFKRCCSRMPVEQ